MIKRRSNRIVWNSIEIRGPLPVVHCHSPYADRGDDAGQTHRALHFRSVAELKELVGILSGVLSAKRERPKRARRPRHNNQISCTITKST